MLRFLLTCLLALGISAPAQATTVTVLTSAGGALDANRPVYQLYVKGFLGTKQRAPLEDGKIALSFAIATVFKENKGLSIYAHHGFSGLFDLESHSSGDRMRRGDRLAVSGVGSGDPLVYLGGLNFTWTPSINPTGFDWLYTDRFVLTADGRFECIGHCELVGYNRRTKESYATGLFVRSGGYSISVVPLPASAVLALLGLVALGGLRAFGRRRSA